MSSPHTLWILIVGITMVLGAAVESLTARIRVPSVVIYLVLGMLLRLTDTRFGLLGTSGRDAFALLADIGLIVLLFRVGLESNLAGLLAKLRQAAMVWTTDIGVSGLLGFLAARYWLGFELAPSLVIAIALTATSIGIATTAWRTAGALNSPNGRLMLDVAELDDLSGVLLLGMLFALLPVLGTDHSAALWLLTRTAGWFAVQFAIFAALCLLFARYVEGPLTRLANRLEPDPQRMLTVAGVGFAIAALADWLGFSFAIGALFAGLVFSRDPEAVRADARFSDLYAFFAPFFFIGIGLSVDVTLIKTGLTIGAVILVAAVLGKLLGAFVTSVWVAGVTGALVISASMIPRAEIALVIAQQGYTIGALPENSYAALVLVSGVTCLIAPWLVAHLLARWPQPDAEEPA
jgi:Kef-type K+ transport system membrane component KefB